MKRYPLDELIRIVKNDPNGTDKAHRDAFWLECGTVFAREFFDYWFSGHIARVHVTTNPTNGIVTVKARARGDAKQYRKPRGPAPEVREARARATKLLADRVSNIVLMDLRTSTGKKIRDCTFAELAKEAGWLGALAKMGKPNQLVGNVLTEMDLFNVRMRNAA